MITQPSAAMKVSLPSEREIVLTRDFDAPRSLVFEAFTKPEHVKCWWGHRDSTLSVCEVDLRPGGAWRFVIQKANGGKEPFCGVYREITPPERLVYTFVYDVEGYRDPGGLVTDVFQEKGKGTTLVETMLFPSVESRDTTLRSGMEAGAAESFDRLAELLGTLKVKK